MLPWISIRQYAEGAAVPRLLTNHLRGCRRRKKLRPLQVIVERAAGPRLCGARIRFDGVNVEQWRRAILIEFYD